MKVPSIGLRIIDQSPVDGIYYGYVFRGENKIGFSAWKGVPKGLPGKLYVFFVKDALMDDAFLKEAKVILWNWVKDTGLNQYFSGINIYGG